MSSGEDPFTKLLGAILAWLLLIYGVCWVIRWLLTKIAEMAKTTVAGIAENAGPIIMVVGGIVGLCLIVAFLKLMGRVARNSRGFLDHVKPRMEFLENELKLQTKQLQQSQWKNQVSQMEKTLADADA